MSDRPPETPESSAGLTAVPVPSPGVGGGDGGAPPRRSPFSLARAALKLARPKQWIKNGLLFAALLFSGHFLTSFDDILQTIMGFAAFSLLSSTGYVLNDYLDREADKKHPKKRHRPIASGAMPENFALVQMIGMLLVGVAVAAYVGTPFLVTAIGYLLTTVTYSLYFKHVVILDVMFLAACYVWRAVAGAAAIDVEVSSWLFLCTAFGALFLGFAKRRAELVSLGVEGGTRRNLAEYSPQMLDQFQSIVTSGTVLSYALYTVLGQGPWMVLTMPYVLYGIFRYIYLVDQRGEGGAPDETFIKDRPILVVVFLYVLTAGGVLYAEHMGWISRAPAADGSAGG